MAYKWLQKALSKFGRADLAALIEATGADQSERLDALETTVDTETTGLVDRTAALEGVVTDAVTITGASVIATDAVNVNGTAFACVASGATGNQFNLGADDAETMANLAAKINALSGIDATADGAVVTVTAYGRVLIVSTDDTTLTIAESGNAYTIGGVCRQLLTQILAIE